MKGKTAWGCGAACLLFIFVLTFVFPIIPLMFWSHNQSNAEAEIRRTVNPADLKNWGSELLKKHPDESLNYSRELSDELPSFVPRFGKKPWVFIDHSHGGRVGITWRFGPLGLQLTMEYGQPGEWRSGGEEWVPDVYFNRLSK